MSLRQAFDGCACRRSVEESTWARQRRQRRRLRSWCTDCFLEKDVQAHWQRGGIHRAPARLRRALAALSISHQHLGELGSLEGWVRQGWRCCDGPVRCWPSWQEAHPVTPALACYAHGGKEPVHPRAGATFLTALAWRLVRLTRPAGSRSTAGLVEKTNHRLRRVCPPECVRLVRHEG